MTQIFEDINNLYNKMFFLEKYGSDLFVSILIVFVFFCLVSYYYILSNIAPIKEDWVNQRCNPSVIPFAGLINAPQDESSFSYTASNFNGCINTILSNIVGYAFQPIYYVMNGYSEIWNNLTESLQSIKAMFNTLRNDIAVFTQDVMNRALNIVIPLQQLMLNISDMFQKTNGTISAGIYTLFGSYLSIVSLIGSIYQLLVDILIALATVVVILWVIPFTWPQAAVMTTIFVSISIPLAIISVFMSEIFDLHPSGLPKVPHCFDKNTEIKMRDNTTKKIIDIKLGDILFDESIVTSHMKLMNDQDMYKIRNNIITGKHPVFHECLGWIIVKDHPESIPINDYDEPFLYCIGTSSKIIKVDDLILSDWDELDERDILEIRNNACHVLPALSFQNSDIHKYLDGGLIGKTQIKLHDGRIKCIKNIDIGDVLLGGEKVCGLVKIDATTLSGIFTYRLKHGLFICGGPNLHLYDPDLGIIDTTMINGTPIKKVKYVYHLITNKRRFQVNGITVYDYNSGIDKFLDDEKTSFL